MKSSENRNALTPAPGTKAGTGTPAAARARIADLPIDAAAHPAMLLHPLAAASGDKRRTPHCACTGVTSSSAPAFQLVPVTGGAGGGVAAARGGTVVAGGVGGVRANVGGRTSGGGISLLAARASKSNTFAASKLSASGKAATPAPTTKGGTSCPAAVAARTACHLLAEAAEAVIDVPTLHADPGAEAGMHSMQVLPEHSPGRSASQP